MADEDEWSFESAPFKHAGEIFGGVERGPATGCGIAPAEARAIVADYGADPRDAFLYQRPAEGTGCDAGFENHHRFAMPLYVYVQAAGPGFDHGARRWDNRFIHHAYRSRATAAC